MICNGVVKDDKTIELKVSMPFEAGQRVSLAILPFEEDDCTGADKATLKGPRPASAEGAAKLERLMEESKQPHYKHVFGGSPADIVRVALAPPHLSDEDVAALDRSIEEGKSPPSEGWSFDEV